MGQQLLERDVVVSELLDDLDDAGLLRKPVSSDLELFVVIASLATAQAARQRVIDVFKEVLSGAWQHLDELVAALRSIRLVLSRPLCIFRRHTSLNFVQPRD